MNLEQALEGFSVLKYMRLCGYSYRTLHHYGDKAFDDLNPSLQRGVVLLINQMYRTQKAVYHYDLDFTRHMLKESGIYSDRFFRECGISNVRAVNYTPDKMRAVRLRAIEVTTRLLLYASK